MTYKILSVQYDQFIDSLFEAVFSGKGFTIIWFLRGKDAVIISKKVCMRSVQ